ncbi:hypothetical protein BFP70_13215 [Thioclava sp. SK-1]|uniref:MBL fold metallo-hydrolase n=1 Tax=Thioclava sp. SK-1 TaxID=1889770 RepID=UPI000824CB7B|nr:MBL fold metallo-hydrolase [Thioclava sp. SK-1]OCX63160.1 hypothetical protein BFP70_13215 [Thioclava sp. SK-1]
MLVELLPGLRRLRAPNPSAMTKDGTNTYILGHDRLAVVDPGPDDPAHIADIIRAVAPGAHITHILVTHAHLDHSPAARRLSALTQAPVYGYGPPDAGRPPYMQTLAQTANLGGGEGVDLAFAPDISIGHGKDIIGADWTVTALHTPGHFANHLSFVWHPGHSAIGPVVFTGDVVMGWTSTLISPPDGDLQGYFDSLDLLQSVNAAQFFPGHGAPVTQPHTRIAELRAHRHARSAQILTALRDGPACALTLAQRIYPDIPKALLPAAARNTFAHLIDFQQKHIVTPEGQLSYSVKFSLC